MTPVGKPRGAREEASERLLVEAAQKDPGRFIELYDRNFDQVYAFVAKRVHDRDLAEDLTADVFHKALANLPKFDWRGIPFAAWLIRIAANLITDHWNRSSREIVEDSPQTSTDSVEPFSQQAHLFGLVDQLPYDQKRVIALRFAEGKTIKEIARDLGRSEGAIKQLQFRGLQTLRAQLGEP
jgi:RNA polymerase sigma-70 factor, ECF subfamily